MRRRRRGRRRRRRSRRRRRTRRRRFRRMGRRTRSRRSRRRTVRLLEQYAPGPICDEATLELRGQLAAAHGTQGRGVLRDRVHPQLSQAGSLPLPRPRPQPPPRPRPRPPPPSAPRPRRRGVGAQYVPAGALLDAPRGGVKTHAAREVGGHVVGGGGGGAHAIPEARGNLSRAQPGPRESLSRRFRYPYDVESHGYNRG